MVYARRRLGVVTAVGIGGLLLLSLQFGTRQLRAEDILTSGEDRQAFLRRVVEVLVPTLDAADLNPMVSGGQDRGDLTRWYESGGIILPCWHGSADGKPLGIIPSWRYRSYEEGGVFVHDWEVDQQTPWGSPPRLYFELKLEAAGRARWGSWPDEVRNHRPATLTGRSWTGFQPRRRTFPLDAKPRGDPRDLVGTRVDFSHTSGRRHRTFPLGTLQGEMITWIIAGTWPGRQIARHMVTLTPEYYGEVGSGERIEYVKARVVHRTERYEAMLCVSYQRPSDCFPGLELSEDEIIGLLGAFYDAYLRARGPDPGVVETLLFDANPLYTDGRSIEEIEEPRDLVDLLKEERVGAAADGLSKLLVRVETNAPGFVDIRTEETGETIYDDGEVELLFEGRTHDVEDKTYAFAVYTPPSGFRKIREGREGGVAESTRDTNDDLLDGVAAFREVPLEIGFGANWDAALLARRPYPLPLVRPPVLLVHGTFDAPKPCWETSAQDEPKDEKHGTYSMKEALGQRGFAVFLTDFEETNGGTRGRSNESSFEDNRRVLWTNPGGIYSALRSYREGLKVAATQVDVVGHSLGGLIPRLWASDAYNAGDTSASIHFAQTGIAGYRRTDNFGRGDIRRLVTIGTPHQGSDLGHLGAVLREAPAPWRLRLTGLATAEHLGVSLAGYLGYDVTPVVRDQFPHFEAKPNEALERIGATQVPSHAIVAWATPYDLGDFGGSYQWAVRIGAWWMLNPRHDVLREFFELRGQAHQIDRLFGEVLTLDADRQDPGTDEPGGWLADESWKLAIRDKALLTSIFRAALFGNTQSDLVVRVESQAGGLPLQYTTQIPGVLHSFAPRYAKVQQAVIDLLDGPAWKFHEEGFPAPPFLRNVEPFQVDQDPTARRRFIAASGLVPSHAEAISVVAKREDVVILVRPVNHNSTPLLLDHKATKDMHVKGKSSNWGPQKGYIPAEQRFSKLHFEKDPAGRKAKIQKYDNEVLKCLSAGRARSLPLLLEVGGTECEVLVVEGIEDPERAIVLRSVGDGAYHGWANAPLRTFDARQPLAPLHLDEGEIERAGTRAL